MLLLILLAYSYLVVVNVLSFIVVAMDKRRARTGRWRIPESNLIALAALGGWVGTKLGQKVFRHKTRKQPFTAVMTAIPFGHAAFVALALVSLMPAAT
ncbi:MAG: DUF1294 domain-containing protein [Litoreibacter sp.]|nr:DUF1294 domain-containing protein [Litoreibacter sp.]